MPNARLAVCPTPGFLPSLMSKCCTMLSKIFIVMDRLVTPLEDGRRTMSPMSLFSRYACACCALMFWNSG